MYFDNLTIAGILIAAPYALLPLLFRREILRVEEEQTDSANPDSGRLAAHPHIAKSGEFTDPEPCH